MALFSIFKTPNHRKFDYNPRFWDQEKEELKKRLEAAKKDVTDTDMIKGRIATSFRRRGGISFNNSFRKTQARKSNIRLALTLVAIIFVSYALMVKFLPQLISLLDVG